MKIKSPTLIFALICCLTFAASFGLKAQVNLVPNPSFEDTTSCPTSLGQIYLANPWFQPTQGTSDYFNSCHTSFDPLDNVDIPQNLWGYQVAKTGVAYTGIGVFTPYNTDSREYIEVKLGSALTAGKKYYVSFYVSLADSQRYAIEDIGLYLSNDSILSNDYYILPYPPQIINTPGRMLSDKNNWMQISGEYTALGGEKFITIGNFKTDANTTNIYLTTGADTTENPNAILGYYYIDDVCVSEDPTTCNVQTGLGDEITNKEEIYFSNSLLTVNIIGTTNVSLKIYDMLGREVINKPVTLNSFQINLSCLPKGMYVLHIPLNNKNISKKLMIK